MDTLYLHIGMPKTATTTIQSFCSLNRGWFAARGINYPALGGSINHRQFVEPLNAAGNNDRFRAADAYFQSKLRPVLNHRSGMTHVLSGENLWHVATQPNYGARLELLRDCLRDFRVVVLVYVRRQDLWLESSYNQSVKRGRQSASLAEYLKQKRTLASADVTLVLDRFQSLVSDTIVMRVFEKEQLSNGDIIADFAKQIGLSDLDGSQRPKRRNDRLNPRLIEAKRWINRYLSRWYQVRAARTLIQLSSAFIPGDTRPLMSHQQACEIVRFYESSNIEAAARWGGSSCPNTLFLSDPRSIPPWEHYS